MSDQNLFKTVKTRLTSGNGRHQKSDQGIYFFAWRYYMQNYRANSRSPGLSSFLLELLAGLGLSVYLAYKLHQAYQIADLAGMLLIAMLLFTTTLVALHGWQELKGMMRQACRFADKALINTDSCEEVSEYFYRLYPWLFHKK